MSSLPLASEFPPASREAWAGLVDKVLKGAPFDRKLVGRTYDGIRIEPLYPKAEAPEPILRRAAAPWRVAGRMDHPDPAEANALALADLEGGADALVLSFAGAPAARGFGLEAASAAELSRAFAGIMPDIIALSVEAAPFAGREAADLVAAWAREAGHAPASMEVDFGLDPVGDIARAGGSPLPWPELAPRLAAAAGGIRGRGFGDTLVRADGRPVHEAGGSEAQELAFLLASAISYLRVLEGAGWTLEEARAVLSFTAVADADQFLTVAKLRALRRLWARVEEACGLSPAPIRLHAETAWRMTTRRDPWVNLLRGTLAAFSAGIGGADSVAVLPFTAALGLPDAFARRLARNTQLILLEEANLWRVADPVAGAGTFEALTDALAAEAWAGFQEIEREGGVVESLRAGAVQARVAAVRTQREAAVATRRDPITGTSEFPDIGEAPVSVLLPPRASAAAPTEFRAEPLPSTRAAEGFERLRDRSDETLAATGTRPRVFLANLGPIAAFSARTTFAKNAFEAGGVEALGNDGFPSHAAMADAFAASGARLACLCSSDEVYGREAASAASALAARGAAALYLAGRPGALEAELAAAGITRFVHAGADLLKIGAEAHALAAARPEGAGAVADSPRTD